MLRSSEKVLILGSGRIAGRIARVVSSPKSNCTLLGFIDGNEDRKDCAYVPRHLMLGTIEDLGKVVSEKGADRVIVAFTDRRGRLPARDLLTFRGTGVVVEDWVDVYERYTGKLAIESLLPGSVIFSKDFDKAKSQVAVRRMLSFLLGGLGLILTSPIMALIAIAIKLDSGGPVFFIHDRAGLKGCPFKLIKFRTMEPTNRKASEWVRDNGERITRVGEWLRKYRLDELPQFLNILSGHMSLIGPRPHPVTNLDLFTDKIPYYPLRYKVRPGVTGWAQVRFGYANDLEEETEKMRYDLYYIKHQSLALDIRILWETIRIVLAGWGANDAIRDAMDAAAVLPREEYRTISLHDYKTTARNPRKAAKSTNGKAKAGNGRPKAKAEPKSKNNDAAGLEASTPRSRIRRMTTDT